MHAFDLPNAYRYGSIISSMASQKIKLIELDNLNVNLGGKGKMRARGPSDLMFVAVTLVLMSVC